MEIINYNAPLELNALMVELNKQNQVIAVVPYKVFIMWSDIKYVEEFVKPYLTPEDKRPKTNIVLHGGATHLVPESIEEVSQAWAKYKVHISKEHLFKFN